MQLGFYFDQSRCSGCLTCVVACKDWHDIPAGPVSRINIHTIEQGQFPNVAVTFIASLCYHCADPACISACPGGAITKLKENGIVVVDKEACLGIESCGACQTACPYSVLKFEAKPDARMEKCDFCLDRWIEGKKPICVEACPMRALDAGPLDELQSKYGKKAKIGNVVGFSFDEVSKPSIIFNAKV